MSKQTIETFFAGKNLVVPSYQRDYAWKERNIDELFADVEEALEVGGHYLGTFILSQQSTSAPVFVVDGQQRLTTLTMLLDALIGSLENAEIRAVMRSTYIQHPLTGYKFQVLGENKDFFEAMLAKQNPEPTSAGQTRLKQAYQHIRLRVQDLVKQGGQPLVLQWLTTLTRMEVLEFIERDEGKAIRMFQTVNDRGVPLAKMDIVKSLLVYYSNRYLDGALDQSIATQFGKAFRSFNNVKALANEPGYQIRHIDRDSFREDDVLRYHYFAFNATPFGVEAGGDYNATTESVLESFLKPALQKLRSDPLRLRAFIEAYTADLTSFFGALEALVQSTRTDRANYMLLVVQDLSATLYPMLIRLHLMGWLQQTSSIDSRTLQSLMELVDLRVFKLRGTNPQADVFAITRGLGNTTIEQVVLGLQSFCNKFMPDALLTSRLVSEDLYRNMGLQRMLWEEEDQTRLSLQQPAADIAELSRLNAAGLSVEHVLPQNPAFDIASYGFKDAEEFEEHKHRLGNLLLLESGLNSACQNATVESKVTVPTLYAASGLVSVKALAASQVGKPLGYKLENIEARSQSLAQLMLQRWPISVAAFANVPASQNEG